MTNRAILGDSLLVMTSLAEKEGLKGKVQSIYFDPPYGIKFGSNWQVSTRKRDVKDGKAEDASRQPEQVKAFRDTEVSHSFIPRIPPRSPHHGSRTTSRKRQHLRPNRDENVHLVRNVLMKFSEARTSFPWSTSRRQEGASTKLSHNSGLLALVRKVH